MVPFRNPSTDKNDKKKRLVSRPPERSAAVRFQAAGGALDTVGAKPSGIVR